MSRIPSAGNSTSGSNAVTAKGSASVIHQIAIQTATAATAQPAGDNPSGAGLATTAAAATGPTNRPVRRARERRGS